MHAIELVHTASSALFLIFCSFCQHIVACVSSNCGAFSRIWEVPIWEVPISNVPCETDYPDIFIASVGLLTKLDKVASSHTFQSVYPKIFFVSSSSSFPLLPTCSQ
jgi:hypothetical protein